MVLEFFNNHRRVQNNRNKKIQKQIIQNITQHHVIYLYNNAKIDPTYHVLDGFTSVAYHFISLNNGSLTFNDFLDDQSIDNEQLIQRAGIKSNYNSVIMT